MSGKQGHRAEKKEGKAVWPKTLKENERYTIRDENSAVGAYLPVVAARDGIKILTGGSFRRVTDRRNVISWPSPMTVR